jgi:hypothetical protein
VTISRRTLLKLGMAIAAARTPGAAAFELPLWTAEDDGNCGLRKVWNRTWQLAPWSGISIDVSSAAFGSAGLDLPGLEAFAGRMRAGGVAETSGSGEAVSLCFMHHACDPVVMDARLPGFAPLFALPAQTTLVTRRWSQVGWTVEEWLTRALVGSFMSDFPRNLDLADLGSALCPVEGREGLSVAALQVTGRPALDAMDAAIDAMEALKAQGCRPEALFATLHGPLKASAIDEIVRTLSPLAGLISVGQDTHAREQRGVSVFAAGYRLG